MAAQVLLLVALTAALFGWLGYRWGVADTLIEQAVRQVRSSSRNTTEPWPTTLPGTPVRQIDLDQDRWAP
jgi:hypothetical protein